LGVVRRQGRLLLTVILELVLPVIFYQFSQQGVNYAENKTKEFYV
jgi:hypothetical protein